MSRRNENKKKPKSSSFGFDDDDTIETSLLTFDERAEEGDEKLDPLFEMYHTPEVPDDSYKDVDPNFIEAIEEENAQIHAELKQADKVQSQRLANTQAAVSSGIDTDYFFSVVFVSEAQKIQFLKAMGWEQFGGARYLNGIELARHLGVQMTDAYLATSAEPDKALSPFVRQSKQPKGKREKK
ncbi:MAG TPA: hypothetical protein VEF04_05465 [Blastocatellia bacterium]|nr:hypothetical protein [Blastocatellia bacterium]